MLSLRSKERRWLVLDEDGRHVWLGRHSDPSDEEILIAEERLAAQSLAGWLAVSEGDFYDLTSDFVLLQVKSLANPIGKFDDTVTRFLERRKSRLIGLG
jgi:hypothetical protein